MATAAQVLNNPLKVAHKASPDSIALLKFLTSLNFDKDRLVIAEYELSHVSLTLYLEDKEDFKDHVDDLFKFEFPTSKFAEIIASNKLNSYEGVKYTERGRPYDADIDINDPIAWFEQDATTHERTVALDMVKTSILKLS